MKESAIFALGCFWCAQKSFDSIHGVLHTEVGYTGGDFDSPSYEDVCSGKTGHVEAINVIYDPTVVSFEKLLGIFWENIDPKNFKGQYCDIGSQYMPIIFYKNTHQKSQAESSKQNKEKTLGQVSVKVLPANIFFPAEENHQKFYKKNQKRYEIYEKGRNRSDL